MIAFMDIQNRAKFVSGVSSGIITKLSYRFLPIYPLPHLVTLKLKTCYHLLGFLPICFEVYNKSSTCIKWVILGLPSEIFTPLNFPLFFDWTRILDIRSDRIMKRVGEIGSPCQISLKAWKNPHFDPLSRQTL